MRASSDAAAQRAFLGLLARPLVTPSTDADLCRAFHDNAKAIHDAARRLGYQVHTAGRAIRLLRIPAAGTVTAPPPPKELIPQRVLSLACIAAAACEETDGAVTLQRLSDLVRAITNAPGSPVTAYDPDQKPHRRQLVRAVAFLEKHAVLRRRGLASRLLDEWADKGAGVGAGFEVDRDALLLLTNPRVLSMAATLRAPSWAQATGPAHEHGAPFRVEDDSDDAGWHAFGVGAMQDIGGQDQGEWEQWNATRSQRILRALVETPVVLYADLEASDAAAMAGGARSLRAHDAAVLTGGIVEMRAEGMLLVLPSEPGMPTLMDWPRAAASDWAALLFADLAGRAGQRQADGSVVLSDDQMDDVALDLHTWKRPYLTKEIQDVDALREIAVSQLCYLGLLTVSTVQEQDARGTWRLLPVAGRYRDPEVSLSGPASVQQQEELSS